MTKTELQPRITLKWWNIRFLDNFDVNSESYKAFNQLTEREDILRDNKGRRENWDLKCCLLCLRAIEKAPENTVFKNDFTEEFYTKEKALDYIINYETDY